MLFSGHSKCSMSLSFTDVYFIKKSQYNEKRQLNDLMALLYCAVSTVTSVDEIGCEHASICDIYDTAQPWQALYSSSFYRVGRMQSRLDRRDAGHADIGPRQPHNLRASLDAPNTSGTM